MNWFFLTLISPAMWAASNYMDKYLVSKYFKNTSVGAMIIFSGLIGLFILPFIALGKPSVITNPPKEVTFIMLNGVMYLCATLPYLKALQKNDASVVVPIFQLIPVISYFMAWAVLKETLSVNQILGGLLIVVGAIVISLELQENKKVRLRKDVLLLMTLSSLIFATNFLLFKVFAIRSDFWTVSFYEYIGFVLFGIILLIFVKSYRTQFLLVLKQNRATVITINGVNEVINIIAKLVFNFASLLAPITLTWVVVGFQPFFALAYGTLLTFLFPHIVKETVSKKHLAHKLTAIGIMLLGAYILNKF